MSGRAAARARYRQKRDALALAEAERALARLIFTRPCPAEIVAARQRVLELGGDPWDRAHLRARLDEVTE